MDEARARAPANTAPAAPPPGQQAAGTDANKSNAPKIQQPKPQILPARSGPTAILVSPRQKGNPILNGVRSIAWEYADIPADYVLGTTTCALFLSLKYHRLHPEYIYNRIRDLKGQYNLRILLTMVDIDNHEEPLKELSKTSLVNNVTIMLCWSAQEAGRYLELFKTFEHAAPTSIRAQQSSSYSDKLVEFITVPRSINKTDAIGLVSNFGSIRTAVNASPEEVGLIAGWGEKKVQQWCNAVRDPFRIQKAAKRGPNQGASRRALSQSISQAESESSHAQQLNATENDADKRPDRRMAEENPAWQPNEDEEEVLRQAESRMAEEKALKEAAEKPAKKAAPEEELSEGVLAALNKLRQH